MKIYFLLFFFYFVYRLQHVVVLRSPLRQDLFVRLYCASNVTVLLSHKVKVSKGAKIRNRYNQVPHLTQDTNGKVTTNS